MAEAVRRAGLMIAMMEPHVLMEEEFQEWYDSEHFPERARTEGFQTATRAICLDGWPRYVALYDLADLDVLDGPEYGKIARNNYSPWTHRIVARVWGHYRATAVQLYPGQALMGEQGIASRIVLWRFRDVTAADCDPIVEGLRAIYEGQPETAQVRVFESRTTDGVDLIGLIELYAPWTPSPGATKALGTAIRRVDMVNTYAHYYPSGPIPGPNGEG